MIILLWQNFNAYTQPEETSIEPSKKLQIGANISSVTTTKAFFMSPSVVFEIGRSAVFVGPNFGFDYLYAASNVGLHLHYQFYPNPKQKIIDFYLSYDFQWIKFREKKFFFNVNTTYFQNTFGYGFKFKIFRKFYLNQNFGLGFVYENRLFDYHNEPNLEGSRVKGFDVTGLLKLGLGYDF